MQTDEPTLFEVPATSAPNLDAAFLDEQAQRYLPILRKLGSYQRWIIGEVYSGRLIMVSQSKRWRRLVELGLIIPVESSWWLGGYYIMSEVVRHACSLLPELWEKPADSHESEPEDDEFVQRMRASRKSPLDLMIDRACGIPD